MLITSSVCSRYKNVALDLGSPNDKRLSAFLSPKNIGLKYIRQIRLYLANVRDRCNQEQQAQLVSRMILEFLPPDVLEEFRYVTQTWECADQHRRGLSNSVVSSWCPWTSFNSDNLLLLYKNQRKMKWLEVMDLDRDILSDIKKNEKMDNEAFQHVRKLALYPENRETLRLCEYFVQKTKEALEEVIIHANFTEIASSLDRPGDYIDQRELNDSATGKRIWCKRRPAQSRDERELGCLHILRLCSKFDFYEGGQTSEQLLTCIAKNL